MSEGKGNIVGKRVHIKKGNGGQRSRKKSGDGTKSGITMNSWIRELGLSSPV